MSLTRDYGLEIAMAVIWGVLTTGFSAYMIHFRAPAVVKTRPELADVGFWTAAFSGRFSSWLFYHEPWAGILLTAVVMLFVCLAGATSPLAQ
jgi:hypothetical protein